MDIYEEFKVKAAEKIDKELKEFGGGSNKAEAVKNAVADALKEFVRQDGEFAQSVAQSGKTLKDVCEAAVKNAGSSISDFEVYSKAVAEYFPGAKIRFNMSIDLIGDAADKPNDNKVIDLDLGELLGL